MNMFSETLNVGSSRPLVVRLGEHDITTSSESKSFDRQIERYKIHERYDG